MLLRAWRADDLEPFAALNADPDVMRHFPATLTLDETAAMIERIRARFEEWKFGLWAAEVPGVAPFIGFVGLMRPSFTAHFTPCVEIGWRIARAHWGNGYVTEAAKAALHHGFTHHGAQEIVALTVPANDRSLAVMTRLGMHRDPNDDFDHPTIALGHPLKRHVLYRITAAQFAARGGA